MTTQQIAWASKHDWFINTRPFNHLGVRVNVIYVKDDMVKGNILSFTDFDELTEWAGY
jgi:hypothetical protein